MAARIDFREAINDCPAGVTGISGTTFFDNELLLKAIREAEIMCDVNLGMSHLERLGLLTLVKIYESRVGKIEA